MLCEKNILHRKQTFCFRDWIDLASFYFYFCFCFAFVKDIQKNNNMIMTLVKISTKWGTREHHDCLNMEQCALTFTTSVHAALSPITGGCHNYTHDFRFEKKKKKRGGGGGVVGSMQKSSTFTRRRVANSMFVLNQKTLNNIFWNAMLQSTTSHCLGRNRSSCGVHKILDNVNSKRQWLAALPFFTHQNH